MDETGATGATATPGGWRPRQAALAGSGEKRGVRRLLRAGVLALALALGASLAVALASTGGTASAQVANPQCVPTAGNQVWCQGQYVGTEYQHGLWMGWSHTAISDTIAQSDWHWWSTEGWVHWHTAHHTLDGGAAGVTTGELHDQILGNTAVGACPGLSCRRGRRA